MKLFGTLPTGEDIYLFKLVSGESYAEVISYGATLRSFAPFGCEILGGFSTLDEYLNGRSYFGATVGRVCNRIVGGEFTMDGVRYELSRNNGEHCLHGGSDGFNTKAWEVLSHTESSVVLGYSSYDGQSGFPGNVRITATFTLDGEELSVQYRAIPDKKTPIMMTSHGFFNLSGFKDDVLGHSIRMYADECTEIDDKRLPTGGRTSVSGTMLDLREPHLFGERISESPVGYDHNYILKPTEFKVACGVRLGLAAEVSACGLKMSAYTDQPGMQLYVMMKPPKATPIIKGGETLMPCGAFCLESQIEPDCVRRGVGFVDAGEEYVSTTLYRVEKV